MVGILTGILLAVAATICLYRGWRMPVNNGRGYTLSGWVLMAASCVVFSAASGWRFAIAYWVIVVCLSAWSIIAINRTNRLNLRQHTKPRVSFQWRIIIKRIMPQLITFLFMVPVCGSLAALITVAVTQSLPIARVNSIALGTFTMPLVWAGLAVWYMNSASHKRSYVAFAALISSAVLAIYA